MPAQRWWFQLSEPFHRARTPQFDAGEEPLLITRRITMKVSLLSSIMLVAKGEVTV